MSGGLILKKLEYDEITIKIIIFLFLIFTSGFSEYKRIGLVLSGGSAKGLAHIGVLKVLEEEKVPIEFITGTSMGNIVGGLYSAGYTVDELEIIALKLDWIGLFTDYIPRENKGGVRNYLEDRNTITIPIEKFQLPLPSGVIRSYRNIEISIEKYRS